MATWVLVMASAQVALAQPRPEAVPLLGATVVVKASATGGFVDDVVTADAERLVYVIADSTTTAALHVVPIANPSAEQIVDISTVTLQPTVLELVGQRVFVAGRTADGKQVGALVELSDANKRKPAGTVLYKVGPATHVNVIVRDGKPRIALHRATESKTGTTRHDVDLLAIETGRRVKAGKAIELDAAGRDAKRDFRANHWSDGWTRVYGIKAGEWDRKEDQRAPDQEGAIDLLTGKLVRTKIVDLFDQKRRFTALADVGGALDFVRVAPDLTGIQLWTAGKSRALELDQPFQSYEPKSLQGVIAADGTGWIAIKVDPVNPAAVARKRADPEYLDVFKIGGDGKAVRKARVLAKGLRYRFGVAGERFWLLERNSGFERGGKNVTLYAPQ